MSDDAAHAQSPARPRRSRQVPDRPSMWPLAAIGGGLASAVLAGAAWTATTATPAPASHRTVRESEQAGGDLGSRDGAGSSTSSVRASTAALAAVGSGRVVQVAAGPGGAGGSGYVVELTSSSGSDVHVLVDDSFVVRSVRVSD